MSVTANLTTNVETITATIVVEDETIIAEINTAARGPAGDAGGGSNNITSATTSNGTANLSLSNVTTATGGNFGGTVVMSVADIVGLFFEDFEAAADATFTYNGTSAADHRIALGAGTTGATLFGAATAAAANESLGVTLLSAASASATRNNNTLADDSVLAGMTLEANTNYLLDFNFAFFASASSGFRWRFNATSCSSHIQYHCGTAATPGGSPQPLYLTGATGLLDTITRTSAATSGFTFSGFLIFRTGSSAGSLSLQWGQNTTDAAQTASRSAHSWLRLTKIS